MIINFEDLPTIREKHAEESVVMAGGCFDIFHEGHVLGLQFCKDLGNILVVGVSGDARIRERKGPTRPIRPEAGRLAVVAALRAVDYAFLLPPKTVDGQTPTIQSIDALRPNIFADNIENEQRWEPSRAQIASYGTELAYNTSDRLSSSSLIIAKIQSLTER